MGFEQRLHRRIPVAIHVNYWLDGDTSQAAEWGETVNLSESGLALYSPKPVAKGGRILLECIMPGQTQSLRLEAEVVHCELSKNGDGQWHLRVRFTQMHREELQPLRRYVQQIADPKAAAATGWGKAYFPGLEAMSAQYREVSLAESKRLLDERSFLAAKEIIFLRRFQEFVELSLGTKTPSSFRLLGSRGLKEQLPVWVELMMPLGRLHLLATTVWSRQEPDEAAESGLQVLAFQKDEALRLDKQAAP